MGEGRPPDVLVRVPVPRTGRPAPGEPAQVVEEVLEEARRELLEIAGRAWAIGPYGFSDD